MKTARFVLLMPILLVAGCLQPPADPPTTSDASGGGTTATSGETERVKAETGVGKSSQNMAQFDSGIQKQVAAPAQALFRTKEKVAFDFKVKPAMELYRASNGNYPKSHEEFMDKIIKFNQIELPELPEGQKYIYDPADATLYVERVKAE